MVQFFVMAISFFFELTVEDPYKRGAVYIEGVSFVFLCMLYFLIQFLVVYYFSYGWLYRSYFVHKIALALKRMNKSAKDEEEIAKAVGREVDTALRDEIDDLIEDLNLDLYPEEDEDGTNTQPFQLSNISVDDLYERGERFFDKHFGELSLKLYKNYYTDSISSLLNRTIIVVILILNLIASKYSVYIYFGTCLLTLSIDDKEKTVLYKFVGKIMIKLFRYKNSYSLLEDAKKPPKMHREDYKDYVKMDTFCKAGITYLVAACCSFVYPMLGKLFLYRVYEASLETLIRVFDVVGLEIHFLRYIYYGIIDDSHSAVAFSDAVLLFTIAIPIFICLAEFLTIPSHIKDFEYEGRIIMFGAPSLILVLFLYESECLL